MCTRNNNLVLSTSININTNVPSKVCALLTIQCHRFETGWLINFLSREKSFFRQIQKYENVWWILNPGDWALASDPSIETHLKQWSKTVPDCSQPLGPQHYCCRQPWRSPWRAPRERSRSTRTSSDPTVFWLFSNDPTVYRLFANLGTPAEPAEDNLEVPADNTRAETEQGQKFIQYKIPERQNRHRTWTRFPSQYSSWTS